MMKSTLIDNTLEALRAGKTILYPTDTIWGIGCDAAMAEAIERVYAIKERDHSKSMLVLATEGMLSPLLPQVVKDLLLLSPRPTTVILPAEMIAAPLANNLAAQDGTVGVRVPKFDFCSTLLELLGHPIVSTSANLSGAPSPCCYDEISEAVKQRVDLALPNAPEFVHPYSGSSRIVKLNHAGEIIVIRG